MPPCGGYYLPHPLLKIRFDSIHNPCRSKRKNKALGDRHMTDNLESLSVQTHDPHLGNFPQPTDPQLPQLHPQSKQSIDSPATNSSEEVVTVELPLDVLAALNQQRHQSGQTQMQVILNALRSALGLTATPPNSHSISHHSISQPLSASDAPALELATLIAEIEQLKARLSQLETVAQRVEDLEGKSIAF
jgi:hypothetical protein